MKKMILGIVTASLLLLQLGCETMQTMHERGWINLPEQHQRQREAVVVGDASGVAVAPDGTVVIIGWYGIDTGGEPIRRPVFWQDGIMTYLPIPANTEEGITSGIAIAPDGAVFIAGQYGGFRETRPVFWRDGTMVELPIPAGTYGRVRGIAVAPDGTIFVAGENGTGTSFRDRVTRAVFWRDGTMIELPVPAGTTVSRTWGGTAVAPDGTVLIGGFIPGGVGGVGRPFYWQGTRRIDLPIPAGTGGVTRGIAIAADGTIHIAGEVGQRPVFWQGTTRINLPVPASAEFSGASGIAVASDGTVFIAGWHGFDGPEGDDITTPVFWRGTTIIELPTPAGMVGETTGIAVTADGTVFITGSYGDSNGNAFRPVYWRDGTMVELPIPDSIR